MASGLRNGGLPASAGGTCKDWIRFFGIDHVATMAVYGSKKTSPYNVGVFRGILSGSIRLQRWLYQAQLVDADIGLSCKLDSETLEHGF